MPGEKGSSLERIRALKMAAQAKKEGEEKEKKEKTEGLQESFLRATREVWLAQAELQTAEQEAGSLEDLDEDTRKEMQAVLKEIKEKGEKLEDDRKAIRKQLEELGVEVKEPTHDEIRELNLREIKKDIDLFGKELADVWRKDGGWALTIGEDDSGYLLEDHALVAQLNEITDKERRISGDLNEKRNTLLKIGTGKLERQLRSLEEQEKSIERQRDDLRKIRDDVRGSSDRVLGVLQEELTKFNNRAGWKRTKEEFPFAAIHNQEVYVARHVECLKAYGYDYKAERKKKQA
jgi:chromosome segregation ATPase